MNDDSLALKSFEKAFRTRLGGCRITCACGRVFYNPDGGWDWEEGELDALAADPQTTSVEWTVETLAFEGREYVMDCDCWKPRATRIVAWLRDHDEEIAEFLSEERKRKAAEAERSPVVT